MNTIMILLLTKDMIVSDHNNSCWDTNVPGHRRVWAQSCLGTNYMCVGTIVSGHNRVWAQSCGPNHVWAQTWWNRLKRTILKHHEKTKQLHVTGREKVFRSLFVAHLQISASYCLFLAYINCETWHHIDKNMPHRCRIWTSHLHISCLPRIMMHDIRRASFRYYKSQAKHSI